MRMVGAAVLTLIVSTAFSHDIYMDWKKPGTDISCCSGRDCYPTQARWKDASWQALRREDGQWIVIPEKALLLPVDEQAHLCAPPTGEPYCFRPPFRGV